MASPKLTVVLLLINLCCINTVYAQFLENTNLAPLMKSASAGSAQAQFELGDIYRKGDGVATNYRTAKAYYQAAAQREHVMAQIELGLMYYLDQLGSEQFDQAYYWFRKAAVHNHAAAQWLLGVMYFNGQGRPKDNVKSYFWLSLASEQNHSTAQLNKSQMQGLLTENDFKSVDQMIIDFKKKQGLNVVEKPAETKTIKAELKPPAIQPKRTINIDDNYRIQLGAFSDKGKVTKAIEGIESRAGSLLTKRDIAIIQPKTANINTDFYRLQLTGFKLRNDAQKLCVKLKQKKVDCFVVSND